MTASYLEGAELDSWLSWIVGLSPESHPIIMFEASIDESGTHENAPVIAAVACVATSTQWVKFVEDWSPVVKSLPHGYHAKRADCADANKQLAALFVRRMEFAVAITLPSAKYYRKLTSPKFGSVYGNEYSAGVQLCLSEIAEWSHANDRGNVAYVIEAGHPGQAFVEQVFTRIEASVEARQHFRVHSHTWLSKNEPILHSADLLSHEIATCYGQDPSPVLATMLPKVDWVDNPAT